MNRMADVAALFGKELDEKFKMKIGGGTLVAYFTSTCFVVERVEYHHWANLLIDLFTGTAVIVDE